VTQRSYANDRYRKDAKVGSTRKSAAKAKPVRKQGERVASTAKPRAASGPEKDWAGLPTSPEIKKWRRVWWALLLGGLALIGVGYAVPALRTGPGQAAILVVVLALSGVAIFIDLRIIRRLRNELLASRAGKKAKGAS
jgi:hypothetical protein